MLLNSSVKFSVMANRQDSENSIERVDQGTLTWGLKSDLRCKYTTRLVNVKAGN